MDLALFDFDGTITNKDSLADFIQFAVGNPKYYLGLLALSPMLLAYTFKFVPNHIAKRNLISYFFKNMDAQEFQKIADTYSLNELNKIIRPAALEKIQWHKDQGDKIVVVSASMQAWLQAWCHQHNIELICTRLEIKNNKLTGAFETKNCHGKEKEIRVKSALCLKDYQTIYAYGDSNGDKELLALANESFYKPFR